jgi:hypothetical protein
MEALYSHRGIHTVLHETIRHEMDKVLLNWALNTCFKIEKYLHNEWYTSKQLRVNTLLKLWEEKGYDAFLVPMAAAALHTKGPQTVQQAVGYLQAFLPHEDTFARVTTAAELLAIGAHKGGLYEIVRKGQGNSTMIQVNQWKWVDPKLQEALEWINDSMFNLPLIEPPAEVKDNRSCGYHSIREPLLLGSYTMHEEPLNYTAINILNSIEWVLDKEVMKEPEVPGKPLTNAMAQQNFMKLVQDSKFVYRTLAPDPFWFCWQYDSRGRMYSHGYHMNIQGAEYKRALLSFNQFEYLT